MHTGKPKFLVICGQNKRRSRTAEDIYRNDQRLDIRSAGLSPAGRRMVSERDLFWADTILVMENEHKRKLQSLFPSFNCGPVQVLHIPDEYDYMDAELVELLRENIECVLETKS